MPMAYRPKYCRQNRRTAILARVVVKLSSRMLVDDPGTFAATRFYLQIKMK